MMDRISIQRLGTAAVALARGGPAATAVMRRPKFSSHCPCSLWVQFQLYHSHYLLFFLLLLFSLHEHFLIVKDSRNSS